MNYRDIYLFDFCLEQNRLHKVISEVRVQALRLMTSLSCRVITFLLPHHEGFCHQLRVEDAAGSQYFLALNRF